MAITFSDALETGLEYEYRWRLAKLFDHIDFLGVAHWRDDASLSLPGMYVPLGLTREMGAGRGENAERLSVGDALQQSRHTVILGDPGSGKSTLIKLLAYSFATPDPTPLRRRFGALLPIPIILKDYDVRKWSHRNDMLRDFIAYTVPSQIREQVTVEWLEAAIVQGKAILLIDGLDEVGDKKARENLRNNVLLPWHSLGAISRIVATSRAIGYDEVPIDNLRLSIAEAREIFPEHWMSAGLREKSDERIEFDLSVGRFYVAPFDDAAIDEFALRWYSLREANETEREQKILAFRSAIRKNQGTRVLASSPRLLTMMALIFLIGADLPSGRVKLYDRIVETYLVTLQDYKQTGRFAADLDEMKRWLAAIGRDMQERRQKDSSNENPEILISEKQVVQSLAREIAKDRPSADAKAEAHKFLEYAVRKGGLLIPRGQRDGEELFAFIHLTFQEYFAAYSIRQEYWDFQKLFSEFPSLVNLLAEWAKDTRWHESLILLFEMFREMSGLADRLVSDLLPKADDNTWTLIAGLLGDSESGISEKNRIKLTNKLLSRLCSTTTSQLLHPVKELFETHPNIINQWISNNWSQAPNKIGKYFFYYAPELIFSKKSMSQNWQEDEVVKFQKYFDQFHDSKSWKTEQKVSMLFWLGQIPEVAEWASPPNLPLSIWLSNQGIGLIDFLSPDADVFLPTLISIQKKEPLLAIFAGLYCVSRLSVCIPNLYFPEVHLPSLSSLRSHESMRRLATRVRYISQFRSVFVPESAVPKTNDYHFNFSQSPSSFITSASYEPFPKWLDGEDSLASLLGETEWLFSKPEEVERRSKLINNFQNIFTEQNDDLTKLCAVTTILALEKAILRCAHSKIHFLIVR